MATVFWMVGMQRFAGVGTIIYPDAIRPRPNGYIVNPNGTVSFDPDRMFGYDRYDTSAFIVGALKNPDEDPWWAKDPYESGWRN